MRRNVAISWPHDSSRDDAMTADPDAMHAVPPPMAGNPRIARSDDGTLDPRRGRRNTDGDADECPRLRGCRDRQRERSRSDEDFQHIHVFASFEPTAYAIADAWNDRTPLALTAIGTFLASARPIASDAHRKSAHEPAIHYALRRDLSGDETDVSSLPPRRAARAPSGRGR
jgi:hypothetical protein